MNSKMSSGEQVNERTSGSALTSRFMAPLNHSASSLSQFRNIRSSIPGIVYDVVFAIDSKVGERWDFNIVYELIVSCSRMKDKEEEQVHFRTVIVRKKNLKKSAKKKYLDVSPSSRKAFQDAENSCYFFCAVFACYCFLL